MHFFISYLWEDPYYFFMWLTIVVFAICCHEYMHARVALWQGDSTAADAGHLTLNPLRQMGPFSIFILAILGIAWGQVPVDPSRMKHKYSDAIVSLAGPLTNFGLCLIFCVISAVVIIIYGVNPKTLGAEISQNALVFFTRGAMLNFVLFVFNLFPFPGFDGWHVLCSFFPKLKTSESQALYFVVIVIFLLGINYIDYLFLFGGMVSNFLISQMVSLADLIGIGA